MSKKSLFASFSLFLTLGLVILVSIPQDLKVIYVISLSLLSGVLALVALRENLSGIEYVTLTTLPVLFTSGMAGVLYYFPNFSLFFRFIFWFLYSFFFYIILLSSNIFNVAAEKPIPLIRASYTASFLVTLFTIFPIYTVVFKTTPDLLICTLMVIFPTFLLTFQSLWTIFLPKAFDIRSLTGALFVTVIITEALIAVSFLPIESFFRGLWLSTVYYISLGFTHHYFNKSLNSKVYIEYFLIISFISFIVLLY